jgi:ATP/ADP translocase
MYHPLANVRPDERATVLFAFTGLLLLIAAHAVLETARDALFLTSLPATRLPWAYLGIALGAVLVLQIQARLPLGQDNRRIFGAFMIASAAVAAGFWQVVDDERPWTFGALYIWTGIYSTLCMTRFWMLVQDLFTVTQAKRVFAVIGAGGVVGAIAGSAFARTLVQFAEPREFLVAASVLALASGLTIAIGLRASRPVEVPAPDTPGASLNWIDCSRLIRERPYLRRLFRLMLLSAAALTLVDYIFKSVAASSVPADRLAEFFSTAYLILNLLSLLVQVGLVGRLLRTLSVDQVLGLTPFLVTAGTLVIIMFYTLWPLLFVFPVMGLKVVDGSLRYSLHRTTLETLFVPLTRELRDRVKTFSDVLGQRGGQAVASILILGAAMLPGWQMVLASLLLALGWAWIRTALEIRRDYLDIFRTTLSRSRPDPTLEFPDLDLASLESLIARLNSTNDREVLAAMDILAAKEKVRLIPQLILYHPSERVVMKALDLFAADAYEDIAGILDRLASHESGSVRASVLRARARLAPDVNRQLNEFLDDPSPVVRATALTTLVTADWIQGEEAEKALRAIADSAEPDELRALLISIVDQPHPAYGSLLLHLAPTIDDPVAGRLLAEAMGRQPDPKYIDALIQMLPRRAVREAARLALLEHGGDALHRLDECLGDETIPQNIRRHLPRTIHRFEPTVAADILMQRMLEMNDGLVRFKILRALGGLRSREPGLVLDNQRLRRGIERTLAGALRVIDWRVHLERAGEADSKRQTFAHEVLVHAMRHKERRATERLFRLLGLLYPNEDFQRIHRGFDSSDARERASSVELLENVVPAPLNAALIGYMERGADADRVRRGAAYYTPRAWTYEEILDAFLREGSVGLRCITLYQIAELGLASLRERVVERQQKAQELEAPIIERTLNLLDQAATA